MCLHRFVSSHRLRSYPSRWRTTKAVLLRQYQQIRLRRIEFCDRSMAAQRLWTRGVQHWWSRKGLRRLWSCDFVNNGYDRIQDQQTCALDLCIIPIRWSQAGRDIKHTSSLKHRYCERNLSRYLNALSVEKSSNCTSNWGKTSDIASMNSSMNSSILDIVGKTISKAGIERINRHTSGPAGRFWRTPI